MMFYNAIGFLDTGTYKKKATTLALQHSLVTEYTSLVAVENQVSRENNQPLISHKIAQNIPDGWIDPQISELVELNSFYAEERIPNMKAIESLKKVELATLHESLSVHFVQTATKKYFYYFLSIMLLIISLTLFKFRQRLY